MTYITADEIALYITLTTNLCFGALFVYHFTKERANRSLMILAGCLCLTMAAGHYLNARMNGMDKSSQLYYNLVVNWYLLNVTISAVVLLAIYGLHRLFKVPFHYVVRYIFRGVMISIVLNLAMHLDIMVLGYRDTSWLYTTYSFSENLLAVFMFLSVFVARKWSEVFRWLQSAHSY